MTEFYKENFNNFNFNKSRKLLVNNKNNDPKFFLKLPFLRARLSSRRR